MQLNRKRFECESIPQLVDFAESMLRNGFTVSTINVYCSQIRQYEKAGLPFDSETAANYFKTLDIAKQRLMTCRRAVNCFIDFLNGTEPKRSFRPFERHVSKLRFYGCDDDCENCKYPDCAKPDYMC